MSEGAQTQLDAAGLQHEMWAEALKLFTPQMQPGAPGPNGQPAQPQMQPLPPAVPHPVMPF
jgi:hypothetical protein